VHRDLPRPGQQGHRVQHPRPDGLECVLVGRQADENALEAVKALGYLQAPVVITDEDHWSGFRPDKINELAARLA
jgi:glutaredoxin-like protein NrdH